MNFRFDLKYAWRLLVKSWGYSLMCASVVALSVGLAIWTWSSVAYAQLLKPLPLPNSESWYTLQLAADATTAPRIMSVDAYTYQELLKNNRSANYLGAVAYKTAVLSEGQASTSLRTAAISPRLLAQVKPLHGRTFETSDSETSAAAVAILSFDTWQTYFAADPGIIGKTARIDASPVQIVGVLPQDFFAFEDFELWRPLQTPNLARPSDSKLMLSPFIELGKDQTLASALNEIKGTVTRVNGDYPDLFNAARRAVLIPGHRMYTNASTPLVAMLILISAAVLLLGGVNISLVFLARLLERSRELALRSALGATRSRILRQCLMETVLLVFLGLVVGWGLAAMGVRWTDSWGDYLNKVLAIGRLGALPVLRPVDLVIAVVAAALIWLLSTLVPAWRIAKQDAATVLASSGKGSSVRSSNKSAGVLVGFQVVISSLVLVVCGSLVLAVNKEVAKPTGLNTAQVMLSTFPTVFDTRYSEPSQRLRYWEDLDAAIESRIPGAEVAYTSAAPSRPAKVTAVIETRQSAENQGTLTLPLTVVSDNYFQMLGLSVRSGRLFDSTDNSGSLAVAVIDEGLAARYWPDQDVLGKRVQLNAPDTGGSWLTIVGVVSAVAGGRPYRKEEVGAIYRPLRQAVPSEFRLLVKLPNTSADPRVALRAAAFSVDRDLPLRNLQTLDDYVLALKFNEKSLVTLVITFALITALVTAAGLFGLITRSVAQRTQEVGIRRALGATPWKATSIFLRQGGLYLSMAVVGVALGVMLMPLLSRAITNILDYVIPVTLGVVLLMAMVIFMASYLPSRRAVALEPSEALRYE